MLWSPGKSVCVIQQTTFSKKTKQKNPQAFTFFFTSEYIVSMQ